MQVIARQVKGRQSKTVKPGQGLARHVIWGKGVQERAGHGIAYRARKSSGRTLTGQGQSMALHRTSGKCRTRQGSECQGKGKCKALARTGQGMACRAQKGKD